jgi:hypothetical protein
MRLPLDAPLFTQQSRHPLTDLDLGTAPRTLLRDARRAQPAGGFQARRLGPGNVRGQPAEGFEIALPNTPEYYARRCRIWFDPATGLLIRIEAFDATDQLLEDYAFTQVQGNVGLTERDFEPATYGFTVALAPSSMPAPSTRPATTSRPGATAAPGFPAPWR